MLRIFKCEMDRLQRFISMILHLSLNVSSILKPQEFKLLLRPQQYVISGSDYTNAARIFSFKSNGTNALFRNSCIDILQEYMLLISNMAWS